MEKSARTAVETRRGSFVTWFAFLVGVPLGVGTLVLIERGPWQNATVQRYIQHETEQAIVVLFYCALAAFLGKLLMAMKERLAHTQTLLPTWDGKPVAVTEITQLQQSFALASESVKNTYLGRRVANLLHYIASRNSVNDLDDQMRTLSDNDATAVDGSYALTRFIIWAMPMLGFLGTVVGITEAIANISPEQLENGPEGISQGLTKAFDSTALALSFTLVAMFFNSLLEKLELGLLERVDQYIDDELAHRFVRGGHESVGAASIAPALNQLIEKQVSLWSASMAKAEERWNQTGPQIAQAMHQAFEAALTRFGQRIAETEKKLLDRQQVVVDGLTKLAATLKATGDEHQLAIARLTDAIGLSVEMVTKNRADEAQLIRLQESLSQNLTLLANSATFEQAVESLTAAIHLLTTRVNPSPTPALRIAPTPPHAA